MTAIEKTLCWPGQNSVDPDQTALEGGTVLSGSTLFAIPSAAIGCISL